MFNYTKHGIDHSERIICLITDLCSDGLLMSAQKGCLNHFETFILLAASYLHDIGMQINKDEVLVDFAKKNNLYYDIETTDKLKFIRDNHHLLSGYWINDNINSSEKHFLPQAYCGDNELGTYVQSVVVSHGIDFLSKKEYVQSVDYEGQTIRMKLLCILLSFGDSLDCDKRRIDYDKLKYSELPNSSKIHWMKHYYCNSVVVKDRVVRITYQFPETLTEDERVKYSEYFSYKTKYWITKNKQVYIDVLAPFQANFNIEENFTYSPVKECLDDAQYLEIEEELVQIVEEMNYSEMKSPKSMRVAIGILEKNGKVVLVRRRHKEKTLEWQFPAGIIKPGENSQDIVIEEFEFATGLLTVINQYLGKRKHPDTNVICEYYALTYKSGDLINQNEKEYSECIWVSVDEYQDYITSNLYPGIKFYLDECRR